MRSSQNRQIQQVVVVNQSQCRVLRGGGTTERGSDGCFSEHATAISYSTLYERIRQEMGEDGFPLELQRLMARFITQAHEQGQQITQQQQQWHETFVKVWQQQLAAASASQGSLTQSTSLPHYPSGR